MHHCLYISELLGQIFTFVGKSDDQLRQRSRASQKTLASLARTCHVFSSPALEVLWHDLDSFEPLLKILPVTTSCVDNPQWSTFRKYAKHVKILRGREARVPVSSRQKDIIATLRDCPQRFLPLLPNLTELEWSEFSFSSPEASSIVLFKYFAGPSVTTVTLSLMRWRAHSSTELAVLADLPRRCPNVTSFNLALRFSWDYVPSEEVGGMLTQWTRLQSLQTCPIPQPVMDQLFSQRTLHSLYIECHDSPSIHLGTIPDTVREFTLGAESPSSCASFLESTYASPMACRLRIGMNEGQEDEGMKETFRLLPLRLDTSRLSSLAIQPRSSIAGIPMWRSLALQESFMASLVEFRSLRELDLDLLCTAHMTDGEYERLAGSMRHLRSLKLGTANPSISRPWPVATVGAVIAVLKHCTYLETLHILFNASTPPPNCATAQDGKVVWMAETAREGWGVCNRYTTKLCVGYSPITDATVNMIVSCFKAVMPCLAQIEYKARDEEWRLVEQILASGHPTPKGVRLQCRRDT